MDDTIPTDPEDGRYPSTRGIKDYVDTQVAESMNSHYRGGINYCSNTGLNDGDPAPAGSQTGETLFDISNNNYFIVDGSTLSLQSPVPTVNGYYYDIYHFLWNQNQSGQIKWSDYFNQWQFEINNNSGADQVTITVNAQNNYEVKNQGITSTKIAKAAITPSHISSTFLNEIRNVQADWNITDTASAAFIKNKPNIQGVGRLSTNITIALPPVLNESMSTDINLHKISKTGNYNDLIDKPNLSWTPATSAPSSFVTNVYGAYNYNLLLFKFTFKLLPGDYSMNTAFLSFNIPSGFITLPTSHFYAVTNTTNTHIYLSASIVGSWLHIYPVEDFVLNNYDGAITFNNMITFWGNLD
jgi:hypothetical protein